MHPDIKLMPDERLCAVGEHLNIIQKTRGLRWGTDSYLLAAYMRKSNVRACELGCGTGVISLLCAAHGKFPEIRALEIQPEYAELAERNARLNGLDKIFVPECGDVRDARPERLGGRFDVVFSNPPYMRADTGHPSDVPEKLIARHEIFGGIADFCAAAARLLNFGGLFICVFRPNRLPDLFEALRVNNLEPKRMTEIYPDTASRPSAVIVESKLGAGPSLEVTRPLIFYANDVSDGTPRTMTAQAARIYETCSFAENDRYQGDNT